MKTFMELELSKEIIRATNDMGFEEMTPVQEQAIPIAMEGNDVIGQALTGTGKTAAFGIPMIERADTTWDLIQGLVITPTRELAIQVAEEINKIGQFKQVRAVPIYGGQDIRRQIRALKDNPEIIVGTPGRLMDHMRRRTIRLKNIQSIVLDEADEMLDMGFIEDIESILKDTPKERQTLLFSATIPKPIQKLAAKFMKNPKVVRVEDKEVTVPNTEQYYIELREKQKFDIFCLLLDTQFPERAIVFGRTKRRVDELSEALGKRGYLAEGIHGDLTQARRDNVMKKFREGTVELLVATDVAARGLDIQDVTHVYNFDIPQDPESYVHRIGRTGRAGKTGAAITFVTPRELDHLKGIETLIRRKITRKPTPTMAQAIEGNQQLTVERLFNAVEEGSIGMYKGLAEDMLEEVDSVTLLSAALKMLTKEPEKTTIKLTGEAPVRAKRNRPGRSKKKNYGRYNSRGRSGGRSKRSRAN